MKRWLLILLLIIPGLARAQLDLCSNVYTAHAPITLSGVTTPTVISGDSINVNGGSNIGISLTNCSNITIKRCKILNSTQQGINLHNCYNITIDSCDIENNKDGIHADFCPLGNIKIHHNYILNVNGPFPNGNGIQLNNVNGGGNWVQYNNIENIYGVAQHPQDIVSIYQCNGLPGDSIRVEYNNIRGGQVLHDSGGAAGIVTGDVGGSYQVCRYNNVVNSGAVGIQNQGGHDIKVDHNKMYGTGTAFSYDGMASGNYSGVSSYNIYMGYNKINWRQTNGSQLNIYYDPANSNPMPAGWSTNTPATTIDPSINFLIVPGYFILSCSTPPPLTAPVISYAGSPFTFTYGQVVGQSPTNTGGAAVSYALTGTLPTGISFNTTTGVISGTVTQLHSVTTYSVTATNTAGSGSASPSITVNKAPLTVRANNMSIAYNAAIPTLTIAITGYAPGEGSGNLTTVPTATTTATMGSAPGNYTITPAGGVATNYTFSYINGILSIATINIGVVIPGFEARIIP